MDKRAEHGHHDSHRLGTAPRLVEYRNGLEALHRASLGLHASDRCTRTARAGLVAEKGTFPFFTRVLRILFLDEDSVMKHLQWSLYYAALIACFAVSMFAAPKVAAERPAPSPAAIVSDIGSMTIEATRLVG
jgi:hypothetical protein